MVPLFHVDAFADRPFAGNPAAVVVLESEADAGWMQRVAAEMNLSETAFVTEIATQSSRTGMASAAWSIRWFSPAAEVELCGHATLAAAHILWETGRVPPGIPLQFQTRHRGVLTCVGDMDAGRSTRSPRITMTFPADPPVDTPAPPQLLDALRLAAAPVNTARARYDWIVELAHPDEVRNHQPDFPALSGIDCRGMALTARAAADGEVDVVSRFFAPRLRIAEDPVTGSVHCALGPYWWRRLGKRVLRCHQASARGGDLRVTMRGDHVDLAGRAITIARGELVSPAIAADEAD